MRYLIGILIFLLNPVFAVANDNLTTAVSQVNADVVFMRHALAPGFGDPSNFQLEKCATQRNLDSVGRQQAVAIGSEVRRSETFFTEILSSEWCRCKETAELLNLQEWNTFSGLNSFFQNFSEKEVVLQQLYQKLNELAPGVTLMVTHQVVIRAVTGLSVGSGELVAFNTRTKEVYKFRLD